MRRDHTRILGSLFIGWAIAQVVGGLVAMNAVRTQAATTGSTLVFWLVLAVMAGAYVWTGVRLREPGANPRFAAIALSFLALLSFPIGTIVGAYGLWVMFRERQRTRQPLST